MDARLDDLAAHARVTRVLTTPVAAVLLAGGLVLGACGADGPSEADQQEAFCAQTEPLPALSTALTTISADDPLDEARATVLAFLDQMDLVLDAAPDEIDDEAARIRPLIDDLGAQVEAASTTQEIQAEVPELVSSLAEDADIDDSVLGPLSLYVIENCPR